VYCPGGPTRLGIRDLGLAWRVDECLGRFPHLTVALARVAGSLQSHDGLYPVAVYLSSYSPRLSHVSPSFAQISHRYRNGRENTGRLDLVFGGDRTKCNALPPFVGVVNTLCRPNGQPLVILTSGITQAYVSRVAKASSFNPSQRVSALLKSMNLYRSSKSRRLVSSVRKSIMTSGLFLWSRKPSSQCLVW
jgi:hypothetical protein